MGLILIKLLSRDSVGADESPPKSISKVPRNTTSSLWMLNDMVEGMKRVLLLGEKLDVALGVDRPRRNEYSRLPGIPRSTLSRYCCQFITNFTFPGGGRIDSPRKLSPEHRVMISEEHLRAFCSSLKQGPSTLFTPHQEMALAAILHRNALNGTCRTMDGFKITCRNLYRTYNPGTTEEDMPAFDYKFLHLFLKRHRSLSLRTAKSLDDIRRTSEANIPSFFDHTAIPMLSKVNASLIFNLDETMVDNSARGVKCINASLKKVAHVVGLDAAEHITALPCFAATGEMLTAAIIQQSPSEELMTKPLLNNTPATKFYHRSTKSGFISKEIFVQWCKDYLIPAINKHRADKLVPGQAAFVLFDSHSSHYSPENIALFLSHNIHMIAFPSHCTHVIQPCDRGIFRHVKASYQKEMIRRGDGKKNATLGDRLAIIIKVLLEIPINVVTSAFKHAGMVPLSKSRAMSNTFESPVDAQLFYADEPTTIELLEKAKQAESVPQNNPDEGEKGGSANRKRKSQIPIEALRTISELKEALPTNGIMEISISVESNGEKVVHVGGLLMVGGDFDEALRTACDAETKRRRKVREESSVMSVRVAIEKGHVPTDKECFTLHVENAARGILKGKVGGSSAVKELASSAGISLTKANPKYIPGSKKTPTLKRSAEDLVTDLLGIIKTEMTNTMAAPGFLFTENIPSPTYLAIREYASRRQSGAEEEEVGEEDEEEEFQDQEMVEPEEFVS